MEASGATEEHFARVAAKNRAQGALNPRALLSAAVDLRAVLASEMLSWPLRRLMVSEPSEGAAAVVFGAGEIRRRMGANGPRVLASVLVREGADGALAASARAARLAYQVAGIGPEDLDCAEIDDRSAAREVATYEALQLAPEGQGPELVDSGFTARGGVLPVNMSGGMLAQGDAAGASGIAQLCELAWQLRGEAERRQVAGARAGLALAGGLERGGGSLASLTILGSG
jgi:acetyl-CoA acetyltransferase